jgi:hypothetical protein
MSWWYSYAFWMMVQCISPGLIATIAMVWSARKPARARKAAEREACPGQRCWGLYARIRSEQ